MSGAGSYPVAMIPYMNMAPFRQMGPPPQSHFVPLVPRKSIEALQTGRVIAAAVPVGGLFALHKIVEPLGQFGIAAKKECMSVLFIADRPLTSLDRSCTIRLTTESASSVRLLWLMLTKILGKDNLPQRTNAAGPVNGELWIGNEALRQGAWRMGWNGDSHKTISYGQGELNVVTDLATLWNQHYQLPFVFARWVVKKDAPVKAKSILSQWLERFRSKETEMIQACIGPAVETLGITATAAERYFKVIHRCLDAEDLLGQDRFLEEFRNMDSQFMHTLNRTNMEP